MRAEAARPQNIVDPDGSLLGRLCASVTGARKRLHNKLSRYYLGARKSSRSEQEIGLPALVRAPWPFAPIIVHRICAPRGKRSFVDWATPFKDRLTNVAGKNEALVRRFYEEIDKGNIDAMDELVAVDYLDHSPPPFPGLAPGREGLKQAVRIFWDATPGYHQIEEQIARRGRAFKGGLRDCGTGRAIRQDEQVFMRWVESAPARDQ